MSQHGGGDAHGPDRIASQVMSETARLAEAFVACTLPKTAWTHEAHLRVGLWHRLRMPAGEALEALRDRIRRYNEATGGVNSDTDGYHETITRVYVRLIDRFVAAADTRRPEDDLAHEMIAALGERTLPLTYYSRDRLFSVEARRGWVEPDLEPLPGDARAVLPVGQSPTATSRDRGSPVTRWNRLQSSGEESKE